MLRSLDTALLTDDVVYNGQVFILSRIIREYLTRHHLLHFLAIWILQKVFVVEQGQSLHHITRQFDLAPIDVHHLLHLLIMHLSLIKCLLEPVHLVDVLLDEVLLTDRSHTGR